LFHLTLVQHLLVILLSMICCTLLQLSFWLFKSFWFFHTVGGGLWWYLLGNRMYSMISIDLVCPLASALKILTNSTSIKTWKKYLAFPSFDFERTWWRLPPKHVVWTKLDIYVFIWNEDCHRDTGKFRGFKHSYTSNLQFKCETFSVFSKQLHILCRDINLQMPSWAVTINLL
jgi:hypothetical protein